MRRSQSLVMLRRAALAVLGVVGLATGCGGGGGGGGGTSARSVCALYDRLAETAAQVEQADLADPEAFETALESAVDQYVATVDDLRESAPAELHEDLDRLSAAAAQLRFDDALDARVSLDAYASEHCGVGPSSTTVAPAG